MIKNMSLSEYQEQTIIFKWAAFHEQRYPCLKYMYSTLNGVRLTMGQAVKAKKSGNKKGVPDIVLPYKNKSYSGLYLELKTLKGRASKEQKDFIQYLISQGYFACVCHGSKNSIEVIQNYIENKV